MVVAQGILGGLSGAQQQLSAWFFQASRQSMPDAVSLLFDEINLTFNAVLALGQWAMGRQDAALLSTIEQLEAAINANPLSTTQAGQQIITLTGAVVVASLQQ
jgi:hypothetical protein